MRRNESENSYATDARDCVVDQNIRHNSTRTLIKCIARWYVHSIKVDTNKQLEDILWHNIVRYEHK